MEAYFRSLEGSQVTKFVTKLKAGNPESIVLDLHLFSQGKRTVLTVEEYGTHPSCRWIDNRLIVLGHLASLMNEVVKTELVELALITDADSTNGTFQRTRTRRNWVAFTYIVLKWKDEKVYLGDVQSDSVLTTGVLPLPDP